MQNTNADHRPDEPETITPSDDEASGIGTGSAPGSYGGPADITEGAYPTSDDAPSKPEADDRV